MKVWRLENKNYEGPYNCENSNETLLEAHTGDIIRPCGFKRDFNDNNNDNNKDYCFGFDSEKSLRKWFYGFITILRKEGFKISTYNVPEENVVFSISKLQLKFKHPIKKNL